MRDRDWPPTEDGTCGSNVHVMTIIPQTVFCQCGFYGAGPGAAPVEATRPQDSAQGLRQALYGYEAPLAPTDLLAALEALRDQWLIPPAPEKGWWVDPIKARHEWKQRQRCAEELTGLLTRVRHGETAK